MKSSEQIREEIVAAKRGIADNKEEIRLYERNLREAKREIPKYKASIKSFEQDIRRLKKALPLAVERERARVRRERAAANKRNSVDHQPPQYEPPPIGNEGAPAKEE